MKEKPILFSGEMVRAILEGRKTMTRRVVKPQPNEVIGGIPYAWEYHACMTPPARLAIESKYHVCDRLWVRETHYVFGWWVTGGSTKKGKQKWRFCPTEGVRVRFDPPRVGFLTSRDKDRPGIGRWYKRNSLFMKKEYARTWLEVKAVRVERLNDITEADAQAEGVTLNDAYWPHVAPEPLSHAPYVCRFAHLWNSIHEEYGESGWQKNQWVWVVEFKRVGGEA